LAYYNFFDLIYILKKISYIAYDRYNYLLNINCYNKYQKFNLGYKKEIFITILGYKNADYLYQRAIFI